MHPRWGIVDLDKYVILYLERIMKAQNQSMIYEKTEEENGY